MRWEESALLLLSWTPLCCRSVNENDVFLRESFWSSSSSAQSTTTLWQLHPWEWRMMRGRLTLFTFTNRWRNTQTAVSNIKKKKPTKYLSKLFLSFFSSFRTSSSRTEAKTSVLFLFCFLEPNKWVSIFYSTSVNHTARGLKPAQWLCQKSLTRPLLPLQAVVYSALIG